MKTYKLDEFVPQEDLDKYRDLLKNNKNLPTSPSYAEYIADKVDNCIKFSDYIADKMDESITYSEYIAKSLDKELNPLNDLSHILDELNNNFSEAFKTCNSLTTIPEMTTVKKYNEFVPKPVLENNSAQIIKPKMGNERFKMHDLYFDKCIIDFLNYENLDTFVKNVNNIKVIGKGVDSSTVFEITNEKGETMIIAMKNNTFYKYENKVNSIYPDIDVDETMRNISEIDIKIGEKEIELKELMNEEDIKIDNNTLELIGNYNEKIKNYYNEILENSDNLDIEKSNMETLMNTEILKI